MSALFAASKTCAMMRTIMFDFLKKRSGKRIYLDYAAATPARPEVCHVMESYFSKHFANASAIHQEGQVVRQAITQAREDIARLLVVRPEEVTFTSGGTESNNLALVGAVNRAITDGKKPEDIEIISTRIEHPSILETLAALEARGVIVTYVPVDDAGRIDVKTFGELLNEKTLLVTFAYANSEVGTVQDIKQITRIVRKYRTAKNSVTPFVHIDASQAPLWLPCRMDSLGADLMTLDGGKCYGPKGAGVLIHRTQVPLAPYMLGGSQESGLRAGTEDTARIVGLSRALHIAQKDYEARAARIKKNRDEGIELLEKTIDGAVLNGAQGDDRIANNINISILGIDGEFAVVVLDEHGIAASTRSACEGGQGSGSHVVAVLGDDVRARSTIRLTLGEDSKLTDVKRAAEVLKHHVEHMRKVTDSIS